LLCNPEWFQWSLLPSPGIIDVHHYSQSASCSLTHHMHLLDVMSIYFPSVTILLYTVAPPSVGSLSEESVLYSQPQQKILNGNFHTVHIACHHPLCHTWDACAAFAPPWSWWLLLLGMQCIHSSDLILLKNGSNRTTSDAGETGCQDWEARQSSEVFKMRKSSRGDGRISRRASLLSPNCEGNKSEIHAHFAITPPPQCLAKVGKGHSLDIIPGDKGLLSPVPPSTRYIWRI
jgi:hypothetical protein